MNRFRTILRIIVILLLFLSTEHFSQTAESLHREINSIPGIKSVEQVKNDSGYVAVYKIMVEQLLDHNNSKSEKFSQKVFLSFKSKYAPVVISTEGYAAYHNYLTEPAKLLNANQSEQNPTQEEW